jgi:acyl transferase domain-containing protein
MIPMNDNDPSSHLNYQELLNESLLAIKTLRAQVASFVTAQREPIAVVGIGCRFPPNIDSPESFWTLLESGGDAIGEVPADRWDKDYYYDLNPDVRGKICTRSGGFLQNKDRFDPQFFNISPREAMYMDPQQRLLLEVAWEALENANIPANRLYGSDTGVFVGISVFDFANLVAKYLPEWDADHTVGTGSALSAAAGRISYVFGLRGPSIALDTACSSSLVAVHSACESLRRHECNAALAGGVSMMFSPFNHIVFSRARMLATDGRCKTFDESANGYVRSEGAGLVVLKRLTNALADHDHIWGLIRGGAVNQDGASGGLTVPNGPAQQRVIRKAMENAGVAPEDVDYVEAHGTGTALGDPIEINALGEVFRNSHSASRPLWVGSAKTNVGHMEAAAGIGGLIKIILQFQKDAIAPHLHFRQPSSRIPWSDLPIKVPTSLLPWTQSPHKRRIAGVSSFGFCGTNAHVIVEESPSLPEQPANRYERTMHLMALSAKTENALSQMAGSYGSHLQMRLDWNAGDVCYSANTGRSHFNHRLAVVATSTAELAQKLNGFHQGEQPAGVFKSSLTHEKPKIAFLFSGQGPQYHGMGRELYDTQPLFRDVLEKCNATLCREVGWSLLEVLYSPSIDSLISQTRYSQPLFFSLEYALAMLWKSWGIEPAAMMGHGVGEYAAAAVAGVFSPEEALKLVATRGRLMQALPPGGGMVEIRSTREKVRKMIDPYLAEVSIAAINGPRHIVISGDLNKLREILADPTAGGVRTKELEVSHAFYSPLMEPMLKEFGVAAANVAYSTPQADLVSGLSGNMISAATEEKVSSPDYWVRHVSAPVRFQEGIEALCHEGCTAFLEIGPSSTLIEMGRQCTDADLQWLTSLRPDRRDWEQTLQSAAEMYVHGLSFDWEGFDRGYQRNKQILPTYPFQRERYWGLRPSHRRASAIR